MWIETQDGNVVNLNHVRTLYPEGIGISGIDGAGGKWRLMVSFDDGGLHHHVDRMRLYTGDRVTLIAPARHLAVMSVQHGRFSLKLTGKRVKDLVETHTPSLMIAESIYSTTEAQDEVSEEQ